MNCITHKDIRNKEAVFYKDKKLIYLFIFVVFTTQTGVKFN